MQKTRKITETLANGYSSESSRRGLSNEYQDDRVSMVFQESCILVLWTEVVSALEGLIIRGLVGERTNPASCQSLVNWNPMIDWIFSTITMMPGIMIHTYPHTPFSEGGNRVWHLVFRLGARKNLLIKISGQKQDFWLFYILFWAPVAQ